MAFLSSKTGQFTYFSLQVNEPIWRGKDVLDFGGNIGNILRDPNSTIDEERYWCLDVVEDAVEKGRQAYPKSHWVFYNRYCFYFNPYGIRGLPLPDLSRKFDYIVAYSVFTNTTVTDMLQLEAQLESNLAPGGVLAFTFIDPDYFSWPERNNLRWRLEMEREKGNISDSGIEDVIRRSRGANWFMLVNGADLYLETEDIRHYEPEQQKTCHVFHAEEYIRRLFPQAEIYPPVNNEMQHCCVMKKQR